MTKGTLTYLSIPAVLLGPENASRWHHPVTGRASGAELIASVSNAHGALVKDRDRALFRLQHARWSFARQDSNTVRGARPWQWTDHHRGHRAEVRAVKIDDPHLSLTVIIQFVLNEFVFSGHFGGIAQ